MISLNNLAAFSQEAARVRPGQGASPAASPGASQGASPIQPVQSRAAQDALQPQRALGAVPPQPVRPLPRGSLLDLRV